MKIKIFVKNPNTDKSIKSTETLNYLSKALRRTQFYKDRILNDGFELSYVDFKWEYIINFNETDGFIVCREYDNMVKIWVYKTKNELNPDIFECRLSNIIPKTNATIHYEEIQFINLIKLFHKKIKK